MLQSKAILKKTSAFSKVSTCFSFFLHFQVTLPMKWTPQVGVQGNVYLGRNEKSGVDPPPSPTTPTSYRQLFCNLTQVHPCGLMHLLVHMRYVGRMPTKICRTTMLNLYKNYKKKTVRKRRVWWGLVADRPPIFFVLSKVDIFSGLFLEMVISQDNYKVR